jgi:hypothetical protein
VQATPSVGLAASGSPERPQVPLPLELVPLELLLLELVPPELLLAVPPELELLLLGWQTPRSLDCAVQVLPVAQVVAPGAQSCKQVPVPPSALTSLQSQPAAQRSLGAQATLAEQVAVSLAIVPLCMQTPKIAAPPSPPLATASSGRQVPLPPSTTVQVPS